MFVAGFSVIFSNPIIILLIFLGVAVGIIFGAIPGLTATMAVVMFLPLTYTMTPIMGIALLVALYIGGTSGGLISAILLNIPGTPASVATCFDGRPMALKGQATKALGVGIFYSFLGTIFGLLLMILIAPLLAKVAIMFGPFEYCALALFSLSLVVMLTGKDIIRGLMSAFIGMMLATAGLAPIDSAKRFTFGNAQMNSGFQLLSLLIGLYAISEVLNAAGDLDNPPPQVYSGKLKIKGLGFSFKEFKSQIGNFLCSAIIGSGIGILPGIGGGTAGMLSYTFVKNKSKYSEKFGTGIIDGVVASETSNNACIGGAMIPLLTLGIPGDGTTAVLLGALMVHNVSAGPLIFQKNGAVVYSIYGTILVSAFAMLVIEYIGMRGFINVLKIPKQYLLPVVMSLCFVGAFGSSNRMFDVYCAFGFGILSFLMRKGSLPFPPVILGFILGPLFESNFRRVSQYMEIDSNSWESHPVAITFLIITIVLFTFNILKIAKTKKSKD